MAQAASKLDEFFDDTGPWTPQDGPQFDAVQAREITEMLYGGAAFGGKTDFLLGDFLQDVPTYGSAWRGILFRRTMGELDDIIQRSQELYPRTGAFYNNKGIWRWPNGASLRFGFMEQDKHKFKHQGKAYTWIGWDELTQQPTDSPYRYLRGRLRSAQQNIPTMRIRCTANPGGVGHGWVKSKFITAAPGGYRILTDPDTGGSVVFIPSRLSDNRIGLRNDPGYANRLRGLGSIALVNAMLEGDWDVIEGAYFDCWSSKQHVIRPFAIPAEWTRFRSGDWGSYSPFSFGWWAVVQDDFTMEHSEKILPRGALVRYREWYGTRDPSVPGKGLKLSGAKVGQGIVKLEKLDPKLTGGVLDPSTFKEDGGPPISEMINGELVKAKMVPFRKADNTRVNTRDSQDKRGPMSGWDQMRARMIGTAEQDESGLVDWSTGRPMIYCFDTCVASIRTIPSLQHDAQKPEDLDTSSEDHAADDWRYGCSSRPWISVIEKKTEPKDAYSSARDDLDEGGASSVKTI